MLNGDIIDNWQFRKHYFPTEHMQVIKEITSLLSNGTKVYYITGNHDEMLRKFKGFNIGLFEIQNKLILNLKTGKAWIFHGDVFDTAMKNSKWPACGEIDIMELGVQCNIKRSTPSNRWQFVDR